MQGFRKEGIAKINVSQELFVMDVGAVFNFFVGSLGSRFSGFLGLENRLENRWIFVV